MLWGLVRKCWYSLLGMKIGHGTTLSSLYITWPHQVALGQDCLLEHDTYFKFDGVWQAGPAISIGDRVFIGAHCEFNVSCGITIGNDVLIASGCKFIDHNHGLALGIPMRMQSAPAAAIQLGADVWLGCNVIVLKGVVIGKGAVIAAGAVVTTSIPSQEIWGGVPARKIGQRSI
ncbi:MAG: acyltransferase [Hymenobacter sp.]|nr:MAG: acyltransferase [Hymenobacter sp.]